MYDNSAIEPYKNRGLGKQQNVGEKSSILVYCTIPFIATQGNHSKTKDTKAWITTQFVTLHLGSDGCR